MITLSCWDGFSCKASACRHSCCKGWEIDIDEYALHRYGSVKGELGKELRESIVVDDEGASFNLQGNEKSCPFLNDQGLCRIIMELGEDYLSEICREHPRFYHEINGVEECGFGLCCEESTRLLLTEKKPLRISGDWFWRAETIALAQKRALPLEKRLSTLALLPKREWKQLLLSMERMDEAWTEVLERWDGRMTAYNPVLSIPLENLLVYFLFRHWTEKSEQESIALAVLSVRLLGCMQAQGCGNLRELSRLYSSEIEYSTENTDVLKAALSVHKG